jgi:hypothetical protein
MKLLSFGKLSFRAALTSTSLIPSSGIASITNGTNTHGKTGMLHGDVEGIIAIVQSTM